MSEPVTNEVRFCTSCGASPCICDLDIWGDPLDCDDDDDDDEWDDDLSCGHCGPWCPDWGGDGLCMVAIKQQVSEEADYYKRYHKVDMSCPICGIPLPLFEVMADELWVWPGDWYNPMIAVGIFGILATPKGVVHSQPPNLYHVWVGAGEHRTDKLICLLGEPAGRDRRER